MKNLLDLVVGVFVKLNPKKASLVGGSIVNVTEKSDIDRVAGDIMAADGTTKALSVTWKRGTFLGALGLDSAFAPVTADTAGTTSGVFKKADGTAYLVLYASSATAEAISAILGYEITEEEVVIDTAALTATFATPVFDEIVPVVIVADPEVVDAELP